MKKIVCIILFVTIYASVYSQETCNCAVLLNRNQIEVPLFDLPNGNAISNIINDTITENYYVLIIKKFKGNYAYVQASTVLSDTTSKCGWIEKKFLGIYASNYSSDVYLYTKPFSKVNVSCKFPNPGFEMLAVLNCKDKWLFVSYVYKNKLLKGWLPPEKQCANPYSTCN